MMPVKMCFNEKKILGFIMVTYIAQCMGMQSKLPELIMPVGKIPIEIFVTGVRVQMQHGVPGKLGEWKSIADVLMFPFVGAHAACGVRSSHTIHQHEVLTQGEILTLDKWCMLTFTWLEESGRFVMLLHHDDSFSTRFEFVARPYEISVTYHEYDASNVSDASVVVKVTRPDSCMECYDESDDGYDRSYRECSRSTRECEVETKRKLKYLISDVDKLERVVVTEDIKLFLLRRCEDPHKFDALFYT